MRKPDVILISSEEELNSELRIPCILINKFRVIYSINISKIFLSCLSVINLFKTFSVDFLYNYICIKVRLVALVIHREARDNIASLPFALFGLRLNSLG